MNRVYILLNVREGTADRVVNALKLKSGVLTADITGKHPDIIMVLQACNQPKLTRLTIDALSLIENDIEGMQILHALKTMVPSRLPVALGSLCIN